MMMQQIKKNSFRQTCGGCDHAMTVIDPQNIGSKNLLCFCFPPQCLILSDGKNANILNARPSVKPDDPACSQFTPKCEVLK